MTRRLDRGQQVERNREQLLAAARRVFLERGFHAASLETIADAAGFSKGVVYSQFESKADLFLAMLERRIEERASENAAIASRARGRSGLEALVEAGIRSDAAEPRWGLLVLEFRLHAVRDLSLQERYRALHERTAERLARAIEAVATRASSTRRSWSTARARFLLAVSAGVILENAASPEASSVAMVRAMIARALDLPDPRPTDRRPPTSAVRRGRPPRISRSIRTRRAP